MFSLGNNIMGFDSFPGPFLTESTAMSLNLPRSCNESGQREEWQNILNLSVFSNHLL